VDVTDVLRDRRVEAGGLDRMIALSVAAHGVVVAALLFSPEGWLSQPPPPKTVMTISLTGGNGGPDNGGMTSMAARAVQQETPPDAPKRPEPVRPPAAETPAMTVPVPSKTPARPPTPAPPVKQAPPQARGRTPTKGAETREGNAVAETGARGQGFGLSTSGGQGTGATLDVADFCCPEYIQTMVARIRSNWNPRAELAAVAVVKFTIQRDGRITDPVLEKATGYTALDINALRAVVQTQQLQPLPPAFPNPTLVMHLNFEYTR
jgi:TonB family protein